MDYEEENHWRFHLNSVFSEKDIRQMAKIGISKSQALKQIQIFSKGIPPIKLKKPCTIGAGIKVLQNVDVNEYTANYQEAVKMGRIMKFVPASGAATRMFKLLIKFNNENNRIDIKEIGNRAESSKEHKDFLKFLKGIEDYAFFNDLKKVLTHKGINIEQQVEEGQFKELVNAIISEDGLNYAELPKGLIKFHRYDSGARTAFEEHLVEATSYCEDSSGNARIHFTISPEHESIVRSHIESVRDKYEKDDTRFEVNYSFQKPSTNTIAVDMQNNPFRTGDGSILFRPGGHGALLENLNEIKGDIIFIKNIDNVVPDRLKGETYKYKRILAGLLVELQQTIFDYLDKLYGTKNEPELLKEVMEFSRNDLSVLIPNQVHNTSIEGQKQFLISKLNRPIRVCGMVKNEGEPGGGPFWIEDKDGNISLQVVEAAQVDKDNPIQKEIWQSATHFSPTDFVCGVQNFKGNPFDLMNHRDPDAGFITQKSQDGRELKALELPGLWNGSMAFWNTIFVEVPIITFNPVKTILDLLRPNHQP